MLISEWKLRRSICSLNANFHDCGRWERGVDEDELFEIRTHLHRLDIKRIIGSFQGRSCSLLELAGRIVDHYTAMIKSLPKLYNLPQIVHDRVKKGARPNEETDASSQSAVESHEGQRSSAVSPQWTPESDEHAAKAQLQREVHQSTSYEQQIADDIK